MAKRVPTTSGARRAVALRAHQRGFSLIELMVVVMVIAIVAALAIPSMTLQSTDRQAYEDAAQIMMLFREARTRAIARGGAELISMSANGTGDRGTFMLWEAVGNNAGALGSGTLARTPVSSCKAPTVWGPPPLAPSATLLLVDGVNLNTGATALEGTANIETQLLYSAPGGGAATAFNLGYVCYTPLGRSYLNFGTPVFDGSLPALGPVVARVTRAAGGNFRDVLVPPTGMARLFSHT